MSWMAVAAVGGAGTVLLSWMIVFVLVGIGWLDQTHVSLSQAVNTAGRLWLLVHGVRVELGAMTISLVPLGITGLLGLALAVVASYASGYLEDEAQGSWRAAAKLASVVSVSYVLLAFLVGTLIAQPTQAMSLLGWAVPLAAGSTLIGVAHGLRLRLPTVLPMWSARALKSAWMILAAATLGAVTALVAAMGVAWERVVELQTALGEGVLGNALMLAAQLAYLPNAVAWAGSFISGTGFAIGVDTQVSPGSEPNGLIPGIPVMGAIPEGASPALWAWLALPVFACLLGGWWLGRSQDLGPRTSALAGAAAGFLSGTAWVWLEWISRGDLGTKRLVGMGPIFPDGLVAIPAALVVVSLAALVTNLTVRLNRKRAGREPEVAADTGVTESTNPEEETAPLSTPQPE